MQEKVRRQRPAGLVKEISERLRRHIQEYCDSKLTTFASRVGIAHGTVSGWLSPRPRAPDVHQLVTIAARGGVSLNWLVLDEGPPLLGVTTARRDTEAELRALLVGALVARTGGPKALVEYVVPQGSKLLQLLVGHYQPTIEQSMAPLVFGGVRYPSKRKRGRQEDKALREMHDLLLRTQIMRSLASAGSSSLKGLSKGSKEVGKTHRHRRKDRG